MMTTTDNVSERILIIDPDLHFIDLTLELAAKGEGQINLRSSELPLGTYNYTLYVNNKTLDTKQMVITK